MKRKIDFLIVALFAVVLFASCERVAPNYAGVLMENYGKQGLHHVQPRQPWQQQPWTGV